MARVREVLLNITTSLDGFIADRDGGIDWLTPPPDEVPADYLIVIQPALLGDGIPLWRTSHGRTLLGQSTVRAWADGLVELRYRRVDAT